MVRAKSTKGSAYSTSHEHPFNNPTFPVLPTIYSYYQFCYSQAIMTSLNIQESDIPELSGKKVIITGASSGIGLEAASIFAEKGASVLNLDINPPSVPVHENVEYRKCDISNWNELLAAFKHAGDVHIAVSNAGVSEETDYFADTFDEESGELLEPTYGVLGVNLRGVFNFTKLALSNFRKRKYPGSIVITSSATAYSPEHSLPVYSASKLAVSIMACIILLRNLKETNTKSLDIAHWPCAGSAIDSATGRHYDQLRGACSYHHSAAAQTPRCTHHSRRSAGQLS